MNSVAIVGRSTNDNEGLHGLARGSKQFGNGDFGSIKFGMSGILLSMSITFISTTLVMGW